MTLVDVRTFIRAEHVATPRHFITGSRLLFPALFTLAIWAANSAAVAAELREDQWVTIGEHGCWGLPEVMPNPDDANSLLITWQRYRDAAETQMDVKYATLDLRTHVASPEAYLIEPQPVKILQAHPTVARWQIGWRLFYCECLHGDPRGRIVEIQAANWDEFRRHPVSATEPAVTPELGFHSHIQFLPLANDNAWLFYTTGNRPDTITYSVMQPDGKWDPQPRPVPTSTLVGPEKMTLGSAFLEQDDIVLYGSTYEIHPQKQTTQHGIAWRFRFSSRTQRWTAEKLTVAGIVEPFQKAGMFFVRVTKMGGKYYLSAQSNRSHRYLAVGDDGIHFKLLRDLGERPSLGNAMLGIEHQQAILLVYADATNGLAKLGGHVEAMLVPVGQKN